MCERLSDCHVHADPSAKTKHPLVKMCEEGNLSTSCVSSSCTESELGGIHLHAKLEPLRHRGTGEAISQGQMSNVLVPSCSSVGNLSTERLVISISYFESII